MVGTVADPSDRRKVQRWASDSASAYRGSVSACLPAGCERRPGRESPAARQRAARDAPAYLAAERDRLARVHGELIAQAGEWWHALVANDELTVCEAVNAAFADNPAAGCAVGIDGDVLSVVLRQQDLDTLPTQTPGLTSAGRPNLKTLTKQDRLLWWLTIMGSNVVATVKEALATAPGVNAVELAVLTRLPDDQRLGVIAYGRWTRRAIESIAWHEPEEAMRFLDIGEDVACAVSTTNSKISRIDTSGIPGLQQLVDAAVDEGLNASAAPAPEPAVPDHYAVVPFRALDQRTRRAAAFGAARARTPRRGTERRPS